MKHNSVVLSLALFFILASLLLFALPVLAASSPEQFTEPNTAVLTMELSTSQPVIDPSSSPTPLVPLTMSGVLTDTITSTPTDIPIPTITPSPTLYSSATSVPFAIQFSYLPSLHKQQLNPTNTPTPAPILFCDNLNNPLYIPDNDASGINSDISISDTRLLVNTRLYLDINHSYVGDLVVTLSNLSSNQSVNVIDRPGNLPYGCNNSDIVSILDDGAIQYADDQCAVSPHAISGIYLPSQSLSAFNGTIASGTWRLNVSDHYINDTGYLNHWCLEMNLADTLPAPTSTPTPMILPLSASVGGMSGQDQALNLDCESRSAVDWAKHFGINIDEFDFQNHLPGSDDPDVGFVGNPDGSWGNIPPADYGVHAPPVANILREYGLTASSLKSLSWDDLRSEIASGKPVIVWIIGDAFRNIVNGTPHYYTAGSTGNLTVVAPNEHTVIIVGYNPSNVTVLNGARFFDIQIDQFLDSWSVLDFMAVLAR